MSRLRAFCFCISKVVARALRSLFLRCIFPPSLTKIIVDLSLSSALRGYYGPTLLSLSVPRQQRGQGVPLFTRSRATAFSPPLVDAECFARSFDYCARPITSQESVVEVPPSSRCGFSLSPPRQRHVFPFCEELGSFHVVAHHQNLLSFHPCAATAVAIVLIANHLTLATFDSMTRLSPLNRRSE